MSSSFMNAKFTPQLDEATLFHVSKVLNASCSFLSRQLMDDAAFPMLDYLAYPEEYKLPEGYVAPEPEYCECCGQRIDEDDYGGL